VIECEGRHRRDEKERWEERGERREEERRRDERRG
jgi:hypothetical protein